MKRPALLSLLALAFAATAPAQRAIVLDDLTVVPISRLLTLSDQSIEVEQTDGSIKRFSTTNAIAVTQAYERTTHPLDGAGWIDLIDGQRIVGRSAELASDTESIGWMNRDFGVLWIPIERVSRLVPRGVPSPQAMQQSSESVSDIVHLLNGDALEGYLLRAGQDVTLEHDDGSTITTPLERIASLQLANPAVHPEGTFLWLSDGSILAVNSIIDVTGERVQVELRTGEIAVLVVSQILGVSTHTEAITPLSITPTDRDTLPNQRRWSSEYQSIPAKGSNRTPLLFAGDIVIPGPMSLRWTLESGNAFFGTILEMPPEAFPWGDCEVVVRSGNKELLRVQINEESPRHPIAVELVSADIEIEVLAGEHGPISDTVRLIAPIVRYQTR